MYYNAQMMQRLHPCLGATINQLWQQVYTRISLHSASTDSTGVAKVADTPDTDSRGVAMVPAKRAKKGAAKAEKKTLLQPKKENFIIIDLDSLTGAAESSDETFEVVTPLALEAFKVIFHVINPMFMNFCVSLFNATTAHNKNNSIEVYIVMQSNWYVPTVMLLFL